MSIGLIWTQILLAMIGVAPPVWFAWLATKQIGQRFRLAEDYAFKAAVSRAYEGFRREAINVGDDLAAKLLQSALTRIDEQPLRFVESSNHGSPVMELLSSPELKEAIKTIPDFANDIKKSALEALARKGQDNRAAPTKLKSDDAAT